MSNCPKCGDADVRRSRRRGFADGFRSWFGYWPYRCARCEKRFAGLYRLAAPSPPQTCPGPAPAIKKPEVAFQKHTEKPVAQVLIQAQSHEQLHTILLTLSNAISSYDRFNTANSAPYPKPANTRHTSQ